MTEVTKDMGAADAGDVDEAEYAPDTDDMALPVPWYGVLTVTNTLSGDSRRFKQATWRELPLPLKLMLKDKQGHDESVVCGNIQRIWTDDENRVWGAGEFDDAPYGYEAVRLLATKMMRGVSMDADKAVLAASEEEDENGNPIDDFESVRISSATLCAIPAFAEAFVALGFPPGEDEIPDEEQEPEDDEDGEAMVASGVFGMVDLDVSAEENTHLTLIVMGADGSALTTEETEAVSLAIAEATSDLEFPLTLDVTERTTLGENDADVLMVDPGPLTEVRQHLVDDPTIAALMSQQEQFPEWTPHVTIGYPDNPVPEDAEIPAKVTVSGLDIWVDDSSKREINDDDGEQDAAIYSVNLAISEKSWNGDASRFDDAQWHKSCIVHLHEGQPDGKSQCKLPIREPNGDLSRAGVHAAASRLNQTDAPDSALSSARSSLRSAYKQLGEEPPENLTAAAPGLKKDGTPPTCKFCSEQASGYVLHAEGMAYVPFCDAHKDDAVSAAEHATPDGDADPENINRVASYSLVAAPVPRKTKDGPGWITHPRPTKRITDYWVDGVGAAKIGWGIGGDFNRCRAQLAKYVQNPDWLAGLCANLHYRALRIWPGQHSAEALTASGMEGKMGPSMSLVASVVDNPPKFEWFARKEADGPTPFTVLDTGEVFGHVATWGVCHIGCSDSCVTAPTSETNYAYFHTGEIVTDEGPLPVGQISLGGGHADMENGVRAAIAHYDSTSTAVCDVVASDGEHGIWVAGAVREGTTDEEIRDLRAAALSGDWRRVQGNLEMVAALAVNVPGFPIPRAALAASGQESMALVAAAIPGVTSNVEERAEDTAEFRAKVKTALAEIAADEQRTQKLGQAKAVIRGLRRAAIVEKYGL